MTVDDLKSGAEAEWRQQFKATGPAFQTTTQLFEWVKSAYDRITDVLNIPRTSVTVSTVGGSREIDIPTDCWGGFLGIISVEIDGVALNPKTLDDMQRMNEETWQTPSGLTSPLFFFPEDDPAKFSYLLNKSTDGTDDCRIIYIKTVAKPTLTTDVVPQEFEPFREAIIDYIIGKAAGPGAIQNKKMAEFELKLTRRVMKANRLNGRRVARENLSWNLKAYRDNYGNLRGGQP